MLRIRLCRSLASPVGKHAGWPSQAGDSPQGLSPVRLGPHEGEAPVAPRGWVSFREDEALELAKGLVEQRLLLLLVQVGVTHCG